MECNRDEALRAKEVAENKMQRGDFQGALKFALKAKKMYADVENITQILTVCEVHNAAQNKLTGGIDMDWYAILQTAQLADEATIKKQYRKLALLLHPDKNKFPGTEAAFKLIGEANGVLGDQAKRSAYDRKYKVSVKPAFTARNVQNATNYQNNYFPKSTFRNGHQHPEPQLCWATCPNCNNKCPYYREAIMCTTLSCYKCFKNFDALLDQNVSPGYTRTPFTNQNEAQKHAAPKPASKSNGGNAENFVPVSMRKCAADGVRVHRKGRKSNDGSVARGQSKGNVSASKGTKSTESQHSTNVGSKRVRQSVPDPRQNFNYGNGKGKVDANAQENCADPSTLNARRSSRQRLRVSYAESDDDSDDDDDYDDDDDDDDDLESPSKKQKNESFDTNGFVKKEESAGEAADQNGKVRSEVCDPPEVAFSHNKSKFEDKCSTFNSHAPSDAEFIICPDAEFNNFDKHKAEDCFAVNQLWALYVPDDAMPRYYVFIKKVFSPFKLLITWLEPDPDNEDEIAWHSSDLPVACGKFRVSSSQNIRDCTTFSHQIGYLKGSRRGSYLIYPKKGETWAIFRDWDIKWSSNPKEHSKYKFDFVEILTDFSENVGIEVAFLSKVQGFISIFQRNEKNGKDTFSVPPNEVYRFSHQVPSCKMTVTGAEREGVPIGSFELDPAAVPLDLLGRTCKAGE
ncbi:hypothetical protein PIB30_040130 [Stylosanthes scabra]|uniref:J domain-containing protein n=1 Tax=Stylosanthes scabra TaxID=79078 RepID=A0ABU6TED2_9FABA|nr:hypothetical protein [Stylosanthes scabra]